LIWKNGSSIIDALEKELNFLEGKFGDPEQQAIENLLSEEMLYLRKDLIITSQAIDLRASKTCVTSIKMQDII
jgi:hypothetical protein